MTSERGQTTPFFLCFLVVMTMFVGLVVNIGQAINRRMALQIAADAGAWTGATNMAIGLNALADVNQWRRDIEDLIDPGLYIAGPIALDGVVITIWEVGTAIINGVDAAIQVGYAKKPFDEASRVTWYNTQDLFPGEQLQWYEGYRFLGDTEEADTEMPWMKSRPTVCLEQPFIAGQIPLPCLTDLEPRNETITYGGWCGIIPCAKTYNYIEWWEKGPARDVFVWVVEAPQVRPLFNPYGLFGDDAIPRMRAAAAAKPAGGTIESGDSDYRVLMVPLSQASISPLAAEAALQGGVYDPIFEKWRKVAY
jgi:hypothetical protein